MKKLFISLILGFSIPYSFAQTFTHIEQGASVSHLLNTQGVAVADYDKDGDLDMFVVAKNDFAAIQPNTWSRLLSNNNDGTFSDVTIPAGFDNLYNYDQEDPGWKYGVKMGASWGDYDNDGFPDLCLTNYHRIQLFHNNGDGTFNETTTSAGLPVLDSCYYTSALWWDFNKDGFLDVYFTRWGGCSSNRYYENNGNGTFTEKTNALGVGGSKAETWMATPLDVNKDGRWDIYLANDFSENELFVQNANGTFTEQAANYNLDWDGNDMGITIGDYNNNGEFDIFISNIDENRLLIPNGNTYQNVDAQKGVYHAYWAWGSQFSDFDLDGDEDLFVANGYQNDFIEFPVLKENFLFKNLHTEGQDGFQDISTQTGVNEHSNSMCINVFDYDVDGDMDIFVSNMDDAPFFYENTTTNGDSANEPHWANISLEGTISNYNGLGSQLKVWTNGTVQHRFYTGVNMLSQSLQAVHFGLSNTTTIDSLEITWDLGLVEKFYNLPVNQYIHIKENDSYSILNLENQKIYGCTDPNSCSYNSQATVNDGSCTYLPAVPITGNFNSGYLKRETYSCLPNAGSSYHWKIEEGEILSGQGTATVTVQWHLADAGSVSVKEINGCESVISTIPVDLSLDKMQSNHSIARLWNEALLYSIRRDFARPTVHARNLFHSSIAMYDAWAIYDDEARTYLIGKSIEGFSNNFEGFTSNIDKEQAVKETISFAMYRLLNHRFLQSPAFTEASVLYDDLMAELGYDISNTSTDYTTGDPAALGNFIAQTVIDFGMQDGSTELQGYANAYYQSINAPLITNQKGTNGILDPNRWQPLSFETFIDQSGNLIEGTTPDFLSPEWGNVMPFAMNDASKTTFERDGNDYQVYYDPSRPPYLDTTTASVETDLYQWNFSLVSIWGSHLTPNDSVMWDISPANIGNISLSEFPANFLDQTLFYKTIEGGDIGEGWDINPITEQPYPPQIVPRGDYARVLAEFWADGPDSETPPGHWFTILNTVNDNPLLEKKLNGKGEVLNDLEWDIKAYFILGGTMHDAAIAAWSVKGWYDYIRPISAIRYMAERGQSTDPNLPNYDVAGIPLLDGYVEMVEADDPLAGVNGQHIGKIKLYTWLGHRYISDPETDMAGVGWILAEDWMPYQRISFVTPPFAGYVSGHSTFSRAAAEAMTLLTGDAYFPGGVGEFIAYKNEFLVFEEGPSQDVVLQWATYRDASDQCSLSRIWGGIHPPADDISGRLMGEKIGKAAYRFAVPYFYPEEEVENGIPLIVFPNPARPSDVISLANTTENMTFQMFDAQGQKVPFRVLGYNNRFNHTEIQINQLTAGVYVITAGEQSWKLVVM